jgi:hypothetical protein
MYSVERPPENWKDYPKSYLTAAIPVLNAYISDSKLTLQQAFANANHELAKLGYTHVLKLGGCPKIVEFKPEKVNSKKVRYSYNIKGSPALIYKVFVSLLDNKGAIVATKFDTKLDEPGSELVSTEGEVVAIRLSVKPWDADKIVDTQEIPFAMKQSSLF